MGVLLPRSRDARGQSSRGKHFQVFEVPSLPRPRDACGQPSRGKQIQAFERNRRWRKGYGRINKESEYISKELYINKTNNEMKGLSIMESVKIIYL